ncbi:S8/S53 family peptidase [Amnibacterium setariae]|uniref:hypothetical protein n=1 Tax=Amnibacterium setariae TaxID=2306585 RepID=UPI001314C57B|nr:hypothetical protein [Amnibacterium setariae]
MLTRAIGGVTAALLLGAAGVLVTPDAGSGSALPSGDAAMRSMAVVRPAATSTSGPYGLHPADIADAYGLTGGVVGATVAVVIPYDTPTLESDLAVYRSRLGLPACTTANGCFQKVDQNGGTSYPTTDVDWSTEASLDVDAVSAACPACRILVVEAANNGTIALGTAVNRAATMGAAAVSMSWGGSETSSSGYWQSRFFTHPGVALVAATGDDGYQPASFPASLSTVIAVGGTTLSSTSASGAARQDSGARGAIRVSNGDASAASALTAPQEHLVALARAKAELAKATTRSASAAKSAASAKRAAATAQKRLTTARTALKKAVSRAKHHPSATARHAVKKAKATASARQKAARKAASTAAARKRTATTAAKAVRTLTAAVAAAQAVVDQDRKTAADPIADPPVVANPPATTAPPAPPAPALPTVRSTWMETAWSGAGSGCSTATAKPAWQTDSACAGRTVADLAADADPQTGIAVYDTFGTIAAGYTDDGWMVAGGTSLAAPLVAGMLVRSGHAADYSDASRLYARAGSFWDVTAGANGVCGGSVVCTAAPGYDGPTGVGTPKSLDSF